MTGRASTHSLLRADGALGGLLPGRRARAGAHDWSPSVPDRRPTVRLLGTRGVPANHGGFETAAEHIGLDLVRRGWRVVVYCQSPGRGKEIREDTWRGIERVHLPERFTGPIGTIWFDALAVRHAARHRDLCLTFGYNTAFLNERLRARGIPTVINMDGIEWKRARWSPMQQKFLKVNEIIAGRSGDALIADHPVIAEHLESVAPAEKITTITYGAPTVREADPEPVRRLGLTPGRYLCAIARPVAENSLLEMVSTFSRRPRGVQLAVLGAYDRDDEYQRSVLDAASDEVVFVGPQYDEDVVSALRRHSLAYLHGHTVGGTNPSLVEALGCGTPVIAHDNPYNRWVAQDAALWFADEEGFEQALHDLLDDPAVAARLSRHAYDRHAAEFTWTRIVDRYERLLLRHQPAHVQVANGLAVPRQRGAGAVPTQRHGSPDRTFSPADHLL